MSSRVCARQLVLNRKQSDCEKRYPWEVSISYGRPIGAKLFTDGILISSTVAFVGGRLFSSRGSPKVLEGVGEGGGRP